ncbi:MAG: hypothetical protein QOF70_293 [Acetobacteraceae bacterium]|jgi:hypothetical protein|nr:hypothetical protein [Rhodopila sp.]MEA2725818.1 hypothetical protein [Acetobacteraceae bacterium]
MTYAMFGRLFTVKMLIRAGLAALSLSSIGIAHSQQPPHPVPAVYQSDWMAGGGG